MFSPYRRERREKESETGHRAPRNSFFSVEKNYPRKLEASLIRKRSKPNSVIWLRWGTLVSPTINAPLTAPGDYIGGYSAYDTLPPVSRAELWNITTPSRREMIDIRCTNAPYIQACAGYNLLFLNLSYSYVTRATARLAATRMTGAHVREIHSRHASNSVVGENQIIIIYSNSCTAKYIRLREDRPPWGFDNLINLTRGGKIRNRNNSFPKERFNVQSSR